MKAGLAHPSGKKRPLFQIQIPQLIWIMKKKIKLFYTTCGTIKDGQMLAKKLLSNKEAVCVNLIKNVESFFIEEKKYASSKEVIVIIKTNLESQKIKKIIEFIHPYEIPFLAEIKIGPVNKKYLNWATKILD